MAPAAHADASLARQVYSAAALRGVQHSHMFVLTNGSDVTLVGWVNSFEQVSLAGDAARSVPGVTSVTNWVTRNEGGSDH